MANSMEVIKSCYHIRKIEIPRAARVQWLPRLDQILHTLNHRQPTCRPECRRDVSNGRNIVSDVLLLKNVHGT